MISSILLAAGQSKRMQGENKLLKKYKKKYLINHILNSLIKSKVNKIIVVLGHENRKIRKIALKNKKITFVFNSQYLKGISTSIKCGLKKISKQSGISPEVTTRLKKVITSVNGDDSPATIRNYVDTLLLSRDSQALRNHLVSVSPDLDLTYNYVTDDGTEQEMTVPMTVDFFWPKT